MISIYIQIKLKTLVFFKNLSKTKGGLKEVNLCLELLRPQAKKIFPFFEHEQGREAYVRRRHTNLSMRVPQKILKNIISLYYGHANGLLY